MATVDDKKIIFSMVGLNKTIQQNNKQVLKNIYLSFFYGAKIGIIGLNGSGKSTLLRIIAGVDKDYQGNVVFSPGYSVGYLPQEPQLDDDKTVRQIVQEGVQPVVDALAVGCLGFGALLRGVRTGRVRWFALLAAANALSLAAQADIWLLVALAQGAYALWLLWRERPAWRPLARGAAVAAAVFLVVGWPALRHTFVDARQTRADQLAQAQAAAQSPAQAAAAQWRFITDWSLPPEDLVEWFLPGAIGHTSYPFDPKPYTGRIGSAHQTLRQHTVHVGWPAMLLAAAAIVLLARRDPSARDLPFWYALAAVALLLALGRHTPLYRAVAALPFLDQIRAPVKWLHLTGFALAVAAGVGAQALTRRWAWAAFPLAAAVALCGALVIRPYVFPRDLRHTPLTAALPPGATLCNAVRWPLLDDVCRWHRIPLSTDPRAADYAVAPVPQPGLTPVATQTLAQPPLTLGLYRLR